MAGRVPARAVGQMAAPEGLAMRLGGPGAFGARVRDMGCGGDVLPRPCGSGSKRSALAGRGRPVAEGKGGGRSCSFCHSSLFAGFVPSGPQAQLLCGRHRGSCVSNSQKQCRGHCGKRGRFTPQARVYPVFTVLKNSCA